MQTKNEKILPFVSDRNVLLIAINKSDFSSLGGKLLNKRIFSLRSRYISSPTFNISLYLKKKVSL